jgi:hypothetical protein
MIKQTVNFDMFLDSFSDTYKNNFSFEGKRALFDYLEEYSEEVGGDIELDPIALCCDYTEYDSLKDLQDNYIKIKTIEELQDNTQYIPIYNIDGTESERFLIANY